MLTVPPPVAEATREGLAYAGRRPLVLLAAACVLGIVWADWAVPPPLPLLLLCLLAVALGAVSLRWRLPAANLFLLAATFLAGAMLHARLLTPSPRDLLPPEGLHLDSARGTVSAVEGETLLVVTALSSGERALPRRVLLRLLPGQTADSGERLELGDVSLWRPTGAGLPGARDAARQWARAGVHVWGRAARVVPCEASRSLRGTLEEWLAAQRGRMLAVLRAAMPGPDSRTFADLAAGMVYGSLAVPVPPPVAELFRRTGTIHLLVASGTQVSVICLSLIFLVRGTRRVLPLWGTVLVVAGLLALAALAGMGVSIARAVAMAVLLLVSFAAGRRYEVPTALAASALLLCLCWTGYVFDVGAQLTYACCIGVYLAMPSRGTASLRGVRGFLILVARGTIGAWAGAAPLVAIYFHNVVLTAGVANLAAVPLALGVLYVGLAAIIAGSLWIPLAIVPCAVARALLVALLQVLGYCAGLPLAGLDPVYPSLGEVLLWYGLVVLGFWAWRSPTLRRLARLVDWRTAAAAGVCALGLAVLLVALARLPGDRLRIDVLDVGAAQCVVVRPPGGEAVLIDAGAQVGRAGEEGLAERTVLPFLAIRGVHRLGAIILSHPHEDHCNLAAEVIRVIPTARLLIGPTVGPEQSWPLVLEAARARGVPVTEASAGLLVPLGRGSWLQVLEPSSLLRGTDDDSNNNSLVLRLVDRQVAMLLPADLQAEGEARLLRDYAARPEWLRATVLLAPHHASVHSGTPAFVRAVAPRLVVISCGRGLRRPRAEALAVFQQAGIPLWRTDVNGTVQLTSDGRTVRVRASRGR